jgi:Flp pilus assembly protein TadD
LLKRADRALAKRTNAAPALVNQEMAQILRARVEAALKTGNATLVSRTLPKLQKLSQASNDTLIDVAFHGAAGAVAFSQGNYGDAISHLEEDINNPLSLHLLAAAYQRMGNRTEAQSTSETLANMNDPTLEQGLIVPPFRACFSDPSCSGQTKTGESEEPSRPSRPLLM